MPSRSTPVLLVAAMSALSGCASSELIIGARCADDDLPCKEARPNTTDGGLDSALPSDAAFTDASCTNCDASSSGPSDASFCVPGMYVGKEEMYWLPGPAGFCGLFTIFGGRGTGRWAMWLDPQHQPDGSVAKLSGCLELITADPANPPEAGLTAVSALIYGEQDCESGKVTLDLRGGYRTVSTCTVGVIPNDYFFRGPAIAELDPTTHTFINGTIHVREEKTLLDPQPGGDGTWHATMLEDAGVLAEAGFLVVRADSCLGGLVFPHEKFDASAP